MPAEEASIGINDIGLLRGYAAFDYLRTYYRKPFRIQDHLERFRNSAGELRLPFKYTDREIKDIIDQLIRKSDLAGEAGIRFILTGGYATKNSLEISEPNFIITVEELPEYPADLYENGVKLITYEFQRNLPGSKTTEYMTAVKLQGLKKEKDAFDVLYCFRGEVLEVTRNNFFLCKDDVLITPKENILPGITRKVVIELAQREFNIEERLVNIDELTLADEAFLCGTSKKIIPVVEIDEIKINGGIPGKNTRRIMEMFDAYITGSLKE